MPNPGAAHANVGLLLRALRKELNVPLFVFSNAPRTHVDRILSYLGLEDTDLWDGYLCYDDMRAQSKPNEGAYKMALDLVRTRIPDIQPEEILFFDDSKPNLASSKKFGIRNCWVRGGGANGELDAEESPFIDYLIDDIRDDMDRVLKIVREQ